jgi:biotin carboxyl carrier protein
MDLDRIEAILTLLYRQHHVGEVAVEGEGWRLQARKAPALYHPETPLELPEQAPGEPERTVVRAGMVGIYRAPERAVAAGDFLPEGAIVGSIDAMRILNPIPAGRAGFVVSTLVEDGDPVEYGQELFVLAQEPGGAADEAEE